MTTTPKSAAKAVETAVATTKTAFEDGAKASQAAAEKALGQFTALSAEQFEKLSQASSKAFEDAQSLAKGHADAAFAAVAVLAKGAEGIGRAWFAYNQAVIEQAADVAKSLFAAKSLREVVDLQSQYAKSAFDGAVAEGSKISELGVKVANDAIAPIAARVNATVEKMAKSVAA